MSEIEHIIVKRWVDGNLVEETHKVEPLPTPKPPKYQWAFFMLGLLLLPVVALMALFDVLRGKDYDG